MRNFSSIFAGIVLLITLASCNMGSDVFTQKELDKMYILDITQSEKAIDRGLPLNISKGIDLSVTIMPGAPSPSFVHVLLLDSENKEQARISFAKKSGDPDLAENFIVVTSFDAPLPPLILPAKLLPGYYLLSTQMLDQDNAVLSIINTPILVYDLAIPQMSISLFPAQLSASKSALFKAVLAGPVAKDAWISWKIDGVVYSEGLVSEKFDRIIWTAPADKGIHSVSADFFPFKPFMEESIVPLVSSYITSPVIIPLASAAPRALQNPFVAFNLNKGLDNSGSQALSTMNIVGSKPFPEEFANGYGFVFGDGSGLSSQNSMIPWDTESQRDFSILFSLASLPGSVQAGANGEDADRALFKSFDAAGIPILQIGISGGVPYVKTDSRLEAAFMVPRELCTLVFSFHAAGEFLDAAIYIDGRVAGSGRIKDPRIGAGRGGSELAGSTGYKAVYNDVSVYNYLLPAFAASMATLYPDTLIYALSFGDAKAAAPGSVSSGSRQIVVDIPPSTSKFKIDLKLRTGNASISINLADGTFFQIMDNGDVLYLNKVQGNIQSLISNATMQLIIERQNESISITDNYRKNAIAIPVSAASFTDLRINSTGIGLPEVESLLMLNVSQ